MHCLQIIKQFIPDSHLDHIVLLCILSGPSFAALFRMDATDVRAPQLWRRPHAKIYGYNQDFSANYYSVTPTFRYCSLTVVD